MRARQSPDPVINEFRGEYEFLSNFYQGDTVQLDGIWYLTAEHAYQAEKTLDLEVRLAIAELDTPGKAKKYGRRIQLRDNWEEYKEVAMTRVLRAKFVAGSTLSYMLLLTGHRELVESNWWGDTYWGVCNGKGQNRLGHLLME